jgi:hypothetical protein
MLKLSSSRFRGHTGHHRPRAWLSMLAIAGVLALGAPAASTAAVRAAAPPATPAQPTASAAQQAASAARTTFDYVVRFWPRWITYHQQLGWPHLVGMNRLGGVPVMGPMFRVVNLINDDTIYSSAIIDLSHGPLVLTIPPTKATYSLLVLTGFGTVVPTSIKPKTPGHYALVLRGWRGRLPRGVKKVTIPYPATIWTVRGDKYTSNVNMIAQAKEFQRGLHLTPLAEYKADPASGPVIIKPAAAFFFSFKLAQDLTAALAPTVYLRQTRRAVHSPTTQPLSPSDLQLSAAFDQAFAAALRAARHGNPVPLARIDAAVRRAYRALVANYVTHTGPTNWVHFNNFADWGTTPQDFLDRAGESEFCQLCNNIAAAGYWTAFTDGAGRTLNGARHTYTLTFPAGEIPQAKRFWSVTAYVPHTLELVPNRANKYLVASYTPGLVTNPNGSITITMAPRRPAGVPMANWLPVPHRRFVVAMRAYGPTGNTASPTYAPPAITPLR